MLTGEVAASTMGPGGKDVLLGLAGPVDLDVAAERVGNRTESSGLLNCVVERRVVKRPNMCAKVERKSREAGRPL